MTAPARPRPGSASSAPDDEATLSAREQRQIDDAVVPVARTGARGPTAVFALVVAAFLLGVVRPWDLLGGLAGPGGDPPPGGRVAAPGTSTAAPEARTAAPEARTAAPEARTAAPGEGGPGRAVPSSSEGGSNPDPAGSSASSVGGEAPAPTPLPPTCGYPESWRTAAIQEWAAARARVWTAAEAQVAAGPDDPAIVVHVLGSDRVEAMGWCAPIAGPERPPRDARGSLFRRADGGGPAREITFRRVEPVAPDALGELWAPAGSSSDPAATWPVGRYVIRLATPNGAYVRYLGIQVGVPVRATPSSSPGIPAAPSPGASAPPLSRASAAASPEASAPAAASPAGSGAVP